MDKRFNQYVGLRMNGAKETDLVELFGSDSYRIFESMFVKFFGPRQ